MKDTTNLPRSPSAELRLDRLEIYSLTARGLLLAVAIAVAYSIVNGFVG